MKQITKPLANVSYSFHSRYGTKEGAKEAVKMLIGDKHVYYTRIQEKGFPYWDVRIQN